MRVLLLNQYYHPDVAATAQLLTDLGTHLAEKGHEVRAIASARPYSGTHWLPLSDEHAGVRIVRVPATALGRRSKAARALDYGTYLAALLPPLLAAPKPDVVIALSTPPLVAAMGLLLRRLRGARLVYWVMDVYPEVALALGALREGSTAARAMRSLQRALTAQADALVALDDAMAQRLEAAGADGNKIEVIDNWVDAEIAPRPKAQHPLRARLGLDGKFVISYSGNMGLGHDFDTVLDAMARLKDQPRLTWLFIGDGPQRKGLEVRVRALGLPDARFLPYFARAELPLSLTLADASLVTLGAPFAGLLAPSKLYGLLAAGVPVLYVGPEAGRTHEAIARHRVGLAVANGDSAGLAEAVRALAGDEEHRLSLAANARALYEARFTREQALERHHALLHKVLAPRFPRDGSAGAVKVAQC